MHVQQNGENVKLEFSIYEWSIQNTKKEIIVKEWRNNPSCGVIWRLLMVRKLLKLFLHSRIFTASDRRLGVTLISNNKIRIIIN